MVWKSEPGYIGLDTYDVLHQHLVSFHVTFDTGREARVWRSPHRYIWPSELDLMAQLAGFELEAWHADWARAEFTAESESHVSVYWLSALSRTRSSNTSAPPQPRSTDMSPRNDERLARRGNSPCRRVLFETTDGQLRPLTTGTYTIAETHDDVRFAEITISLDSQG